MKPVSVDLFNGLLEFFLLNMGLLAARNMGKLKGQPAWLRVYAAAGPLTARLSAAQVGAQQLSDAERKKLPRYPVPCFRMGRIARTLESRGAGLGEVLLGCAVDRCLHARALVGAYALLVDAKDEKSKSFYEGYGFISLADTPMTLYLPLG